MANYKSKIKKYKIYTLAKKFSENDDVEEIIKRYAQNGKINRVVDIRVSKNLKHNYKFPINDLESTKDFIESLGLEYECRTFFEILPIYNLNFYKKFLEDYYGGNSRLTKHYPGKSWHKTLILGEYVDVDYSTTLAEFIRYKFIKRNYKNVKFDIIKLENIEPIKIYSFYFKEKADIKIYRKMRELGIDCVIDTRAIETIREFETEEDNLKDYADYMSMIAPFKYYHIREYIWTRPNVIEQYVVNNEAICDFITENYKVFINYKNVLILGEYDESKDYAFLYAKRFARIINCLYLDCNAEKL